LPLHRYVSDKLTMLVGQWKRRQSPGKAKFSAATRLRSLVGSKTYSDVQLVVGKSATQLPAHRVVLAARSNVLADMLFPYVSCENLATISRVVCHRNPSRLLCLNSQILVAACLFHTQLSAVSRRCVGVSRSAAVHVHRRNQPDRLFSALHFCHSFRITCGAEQNVAAILTLAMRCTLVRSFPRNFISSPLNRRDRWTAQPLPEIREQARERPAGQRGLPRTHARHPRRNADAQRSRCQRSEVFSLSPSCALRAHFSRGLVRRCSPQIRLFHAVVRW